MKKPRDPDDPRGPRDEHEGRDESSRDARAGEERRDEGGRERERDEHEDPREREPMVPAAGFPETGEPRRVEGGEGEEDEAVERARRGEPSEVYEQQQRESPDVQEMHQPIMREQSEPQDGYEPVPLWWLLLIFGILMWGGWYLGAHSADFALRTYDGPDAFDAGAGVVEQAGEEEAPDPMQVGQRFYNNCMACHQRDGEGLPGQYPPLGGSRWVTGEPEVLARILLHGLGGSITVRGETYSGQMPGWARFDDRQIAGVMTYVRNSFGNDASAVDPELVAAVREATSGRTDAWTADELEEVAAGLPEEGAQEPAADDAGGDASPDDEQGGDDAPESGDAGQGGEGAP